MSFHILLLAMLVAACSGSNGKNGDPDGSSNCHPITEKGVCNIFDQCGCEEGEWCRMSFDDSDCTFFEDCTSTPMGGARVEEECVGRYPAIGECEPGLDCFWTEHMYSPRCTEWCRVDADCSVEGRTCSVPIAVSNMYCTIPVTAPLNACNMSF